MSFAGQLYFLLMSLVSGLVIARLIGPGSLGLFNLTRTLCEGISLFTKAGFDLGVVRYLGERQGDSDRSTPVLVTRRVVMLVFLLGLVPLVIAASGGAQFLERHVYQLDGFGLALIVMAIAIPFMTLVQVLGGVFRGFLRIAPRVWMELLLQPTLRLMFFLCFGVFLAGLWSVIWATVLSFAVAAIGMTVWARRTVLSLPATNGEGTLSSWPEVGRIGKYSIVLGMSVLMAFVVSRADILLLGGSVSASVLGQYAAAQMLVSLLGTFNLALAQAAAPLVARMGREGDISALSLLLHQHSRWVAITTVPFFLVLVFFGDDIVGLLGSGFVSPEPIIPVLAASQLVNAMFSSAGYTLSMTGRHVLELRIMAVGAVANVALNIVLIPRFGVLGAALAALAGAIIANGLRTRAVTSVYGVSPIGSDVLRPVFLCVVTFVSVSWLGFLLVPSGGLSLAAICSMVSMILYVTGLYAYGLTGTDRDAISRLFRSMRRARPLPIQ